MMATFGLPTYPDTGRSATIELPTRGAAVTDQIHEQVIEAPAADVWRFMVDPAALSVWFGADAWLDPGPGGAIAFRSGDGSVQG